MTIQTITDFLLKCEAFASLHPEAAARLAQYVHVEQFPAGTYLVRKGQAGTCMFVMYRGQVRIPVVDEDGRQSFTAHLNSGDVFGEMALLTDEPRNADCIAESDCECVVIPKQIVNQLLRDHPDVAGFLTNILGKRLMERGGIQEVGRYRLTGEIIGRGGMAIVFEGFHRTLGRSVAIKMLSHSLLYRRHFAERFRHEASIIAQLRHPNIVDVYDTEQAYATMFIIMEKLTGRDVEQILDERGTMTFDEVRRVLRDTASALAYAHRKGIVHRDVKPSNVFINADGTVKLMDFGIAAVDGVEDKMTRDRGIYLGTPVYSSPEHAMGKAVDGRSDIYSLGIVAYEMLTGMLPFDDENIQNVLRDQIEKELPSPRNYVSDIPQDLYDFIYKACAKKPEDRFQNCEEIVRLFDRHKRTQTSPEEVGFRSISFLYSPQMAPVIDEIVKEVKRRTQGVDGVVVRVSE
jgi:CRP-like cAMP-binding protein